MKLQHIIFLLIFFISFLFSFPANAENQQNLQPPQALCLPGIYLDEKDLECSLLGPAEHLTYIAWMESEIISITERYPLIDESYGTIHLDYLEVNEDDPRYKYASLEDAIQGGKRSSRLSEGNAYVSYINQVEDNGKTYYELSDGYWIRGGAISRIAEPNMFRGVLLDGTPERPFGWVLKDTETREKPGYYNDTGTGNMIDRYTIIEVFDIEKTGKSYWYMVAPDQWLYQTEVALVFPSNDPPEGVYVDRWIEISLFEQSIAVYDNGEMIFASLTTTGASRTATRPGLFQIYEKHIITGMAGGSKEKGDYYNLKDVPWTMYFDERRALHAEYWHDHLGYRSSHGCANLSFPDAQWLYEWAQMGDWVYVWE
ncbi:MAG: L,D-transpeptidase [Anaerolineales bacterium]|jgi:hypothetical protein